MGGEKKGSGVASLPKTRTSNSIQSTTSVHCLQDITEILRGDVGSTFNVEQTVVGTHIRW